MNQTALFFSPFSAVQKHREVELLLALNIDSKNVKPILLTCKGLFNSFCVAMSASGFTENSTPAELKSVCNTCSNISSMTQDFFGFPNEFVEDYLNGFSREDCKSLLEMVNQMNWLDFHYRGVPIGKFAAYEFFLNHKLSTTVIPPSIWPFFLKHLENCILVTEIAFNYFNIHVHERVYTYNRLYAINRIFCHVAEMHEISTYSLQCAGPIANYYSRLSIVRTDQEIFQLARSREWENYSHSPLGLRDLLRAKSHLKHLRKATSPWVYSAPGKKLTAEQIRRKLGIFETQKVFLLKTSSQDEILAANLAGVFTSSELVPLFGSSIDWVEFVAHEVKKRPDWFLIIRPHPREFSNKREKVESGSGIRLLAYLQKFRGEKNIFVNEPSQNWSIYDLAKVTSVHLNSSSTVGLEMALLGIPSLVYSKTVLVGYPPEISFEAKSEHEYIEQMSTLNKDVSIEVRKMAIQWVGFKYFESTLKYRFIQNVLPYTMGNFMRRLDNRITSKYFLIITLGGSSRIFARLWSLLPQSISLFENVKAEQKKTIGVDVRASERIRLFLFRVITRKFR